MTTVYVVVGESGDYSSRSEWLVRAFATENEATEFVAVCEAHLLARPDVPVPYPRSWPGSYQYWPAGDVGTYEQQRAAWLAIPENAAEVRRWDDYQESLRNHWAAGPDDQASDKDTTYRIDTVPFGPKE